MTDSIASIQEYLEEIDRQLKIIQHSLNLLKERINKSGVKVK